MTRFAPAMAGEPWALSEVTFRYRRFTALIERNACARHQAHAEELAVQWENRSVDHALSPRVQCGLPPASVHRKQNASCENGFHRMGVCRKPADRCQSPR